MPVFSPSGCSFAEAGQYRSSLIANQARLHPNPFSSKLRTSPFFINAVSFGAIVLVLVMLDVTRLHPTRPLKREPGQVREGLLYIRQDRVLRLTVAAMSLIFIAAYNFRLWFRSWHPGCSAGQA